MENNSAVRAFLPLSLIFVVTTALFITLRSTWEGLHIDPNVLIIGNGILFFITLIAFYFYSRALRDRNNMAFMRMVTLGMFVKLMLCALTAIVYIFSFRKGVNKGGLFTCMFLYLLYTFVEVGVLMKLSKQQKNA
ncbi:MAG: hypothetical protein P0Y53_14680 [Candidatus Pseudobacter hemicellulosilyticus]|uniref:Uncharacterized protein n=1 Tax=Candidatus Pseudobacter hemicellulosilyticus TaxID=3121375 RepID=A0AAJ5WPP9_9BACT|nr:MAG: hypothetical protein P0Y53_14680 [Pseudobacter sp.]